MPNNIKKFAFCYKYSALISGYRHKRYHKNVSHDWISFPFFFLHVPKSAGTSVVRSLGLKDPGHLLVNEYSKSTRKILRRKTALLVIRDPFERLLSTYRYAKKMREKSGVGYLCDIEKFDSFDNWVKARLGKNYIRKHYFLRPASYYIKSAKDNDMEVYVVCMEYLQESLESFFEQQGVAIPDLRNDNKTKQDKSNICGGEGGSKKVIYSLYHEDRILHSKALREGGFWV